MIRKKDILIIAVVLAIALGAYGAMRLVRSREAVSGMVEVYARGELFGTAPLSVDQEIRVEQEGGAVNVIRIEGGAVRMAHSSCKNQLCLAQGEITAENWKGRSLGRTIVCLPNQVLVELALEGAERSIQEENIADI